MSEREHDQPVEQRSSIKITRNAKGEAQYEIKAYEGVSGEELTRLRALAIAEYDALYAHFGRAA